MKKVITILLIILLGNSLHAQNVNFDWVKQLGEPLWEKGNSITVDASGNVYTTGEFVGSIDFDPGPGVFILSAINDSYAFITKFDSNGNFIWAKSFEGNSVDGLSIKVDALGNVYTLGTYISVDLDPGPGIFMSDPGGGIFISKLDISGNFVWGKTVRTVFTFTVPFNLALDDAQNVYVTGTHGAYVDFDPGPGIYILPTIGGSIDIFILKLNVNGDFIWAKNIGSTFHDESNAIAVDNQGYVYITGQFTGTCDFDPGPGVFNSTTNYWTAFVLKLNTDGEFIWEKNVVPFNYNASGTSIAVDQAGSVFFAGTYIADVDFDPGPGVYILSSIEYGDCFICKLDVNGDFKWAKSIGSSAPDYLSGITLDVLGDIYATGNFYLTIDFDPGNGTYNLTTAGERDVFVMKLDTQGNFVWAKAMGGPLDDYGTSIAVDNARSVYTTGTFEGVADFDPGPGVTNLTSMGYEDIFIHKLSRCLNSSSSTINATVCNTYTLNTQTYNTSGTYTQIIPNTAGCDSIITLYLTVNRKFTTINASICEGQSYYAGGANQTISGIYKDTLLTTLGCDSIITTSLTVYPAPKPNLGVDRNICSNTVASITPGIFNTYLWQDNSTQPDLVVNSPGQYWVTVTGANNCTASDTVNILAIDTLPVNFLPADQQLCYGNVLKITVPGYKNYLWNTGSTTDNITVSNFGIYYLTATDLNNCTGTDSINIQRKNCIYIGIPNAFTPNKDSKNDVFKPTINQAVQQYSFIIYNRYGQKVFETNNYGTGWDGRLKGKEQPAGTYVYRIVYTNSFGYESENNGTVLLLR